MHVNHGLYKPLHIIILYCVMFNYFSSFSPRRRSAVLCNWRFFLFHLVSRPRDLTPPRRGCRVAVTRGRFSREWTIVFGRHARLKNERHALHREQHVARGKRFNKNTNLAEFCRERGGLG